MRGRKNEERYISASFSTATAFNGSAFTLSRCSDSSNRRVRTLKCALYGQNFLPFQIKKLKIKMVVVVVVLAVDRRRRRVKDQSANRSDAATTAVVRKEVDFPVLQSVSQFVSQLVSGRH